MLNGKQKRFLRALGTKERAIVQIGKDGLSYNICNSLNNALTAHELVKVALLKTSPNNVNEVAIELAANCNCEVVQIIGRNILLYRPSSQHLITLP